MKERDAVRFFHPRHEKDRTGVVIYLQERHAIVIYGRGTAFEADERVEVPERSSQATQLDLYKTTYFYPRSVARVALAKLWEVGHCPPSLFIRLRALADKGIRLMMTLE